MRLLFLTLGVPHPANGGAATRDAALIRHLARRHQVRVLALVDVAADLELLGPARSSLAGAELETFLLGRAPARFLRALARSRGRRSSLVTRSFHHPALAARLSAVAAEWRPDVVQFEHSFLAGYLAALPESPRPATVLSLHNIGAVQYASIAALPAPRGVRLVRRAKALLMKGWEPRVARRFDRSLTVSGADRERILAAEPEAKVSVIENGADPSNLVAPIRSEADPSLIFTGTMAYPPNADAAVRLCRSILPRLRGAEPKARIVVVGREPPAAVRELDREPGVTVTGAVPDVTPWLSRATVAAVPLRAGSGSRLKILEALSIGVPVVSTSYGCAGLAVRDGEHVLMGDSDAEFAEAARRLLTNPGLRERLAVSGRRLVMDRYDWSAIAKRLEGVYQELGEAAPSP